MILLGRYVRRPAEMLKHSRVARAACPSDAGLPDNCVPGNSEFPIPKGIIAGFKQFCVIYRIRFNSSRALKRYLSFTSLCVWSFMTSVASNHYNEQHEDGFACPQQDRATGKVPTTNAWLKHVAKTRQKDGIMSTSSATSATKSAAMHPNRKCT